MRFFFYGTLLEGSDNPVAREIHSLLEPVGAARVAGQLFAIPNPDGWYPALLGGGGEAHGMLYAARPQFSADDLARIDAYEDFDPANPEASLYIRRSISLVEGGEAQAYVWKRPLPDGARPISHGDFRRWLADQGLRQFTGLRDAR
jgi:gamma-glutamylcyclotransferase (GGCT)/AIG2-like uncharacterized protein YtfP